MADPMVEVSSLHAPTVMTMSQTNAIDFKLLLVVRIMFNPIIRGFKPQYLSIGYICLIIRIDWSPSINCFKAIELRLLGHTDSSHQKAPHSPDPGMQTI